MLPLLAADIPIACNLIVVSLSLLVSRYIKKAAVAREEDIITEQRSACRSSSREGQG